MLEPVGPLASSVYWRRRCLALGLAVLVLVLVVTVASAGGEETPVDGDPRTAAVAAPGPTPTTAPSPTPSAAPSPTPTAVPAAALPDIPTPTVPLGGAVGGVPTRGPGALGTPPGGDGFPSLLPAGTTPPGADPSPATTAPVTTAPPPAARAAPAPGPCADSDLRVVARTDRPRYAAGQKPAFSLVVTNTGTVPCTRDLDAAKQAVAVVRTPGDGLWGSNDCAPGDTDDVRTLAPGQEAVFSLRWSGRTSAPGCAGTRAVVPPGDYQLLARLDDIVSPPTRFTLEG